MTRRNQASLTHLGRQLLHSLFDLALERLLKGGNHPLYVLPLVALVLWMVPWSRSIRMYGFPLKHSC